MTTREGGSNAPDVVLVTEDGERINCHRSVLSKCSPYFTAMFSLDFKEKHEKIVRIQDVNGLALRMLVDSCYDMPLRLDYESALLLLPPAAILQFASCVESCRQVLSQNINSQKSLEIFAVADTLSLQELRRQSLSYLLFHYSRIARETRVFSKASQDLLISLLSNSNLCCKDEIEVFECITNWLEDNKQEIQDVEQEWPCLIKCLKFSSMDFNDIRSLSCFPAVQDSSFLLELMDCISAIKSGKPVKSCGCRCHGTLHEDFSLFCKNCLEQCISGKTDTGKTVSSQNLNNILCCVKSPIQNLGTELQILQPEQVEGVKVFNERIVGFANELLKAGPRCLSFFPCVVGHIEQSQKSEAMEDIVELPRSRLQQSSRDPVLLVFDPSAKTMKVFVTLDKANQGPTEATGYKLCALGKDIYVIGGEYMLGYNNWQKSIWKYDSFTCKWNVETSLPHTRRHHSVCVLDEFIYVIGGFGRYRIILNSVDRYDTLKCEWGKCMPLPQPLYASATCSHKGLIYVFASQVMVYYPTQDYWETLSEILMPGDVIFTSAMASLKDGIFLTGSTSKFLYRIDMDESPLQLQVVGSFENAVLNSCIDPSRSVIYSFASATDDDNQKLVVEAYDIRKKKFDILWQSPVPSPINNLKIEDFCPQHSSGCFPLMQF